MFLYAFYPTEFVYFSLCSTIQVEKVKNTSEILHSVTQTKRSLFLINILIAIFATVVDSRTRRERRMPAKMHTRFIYVELFLVRILRGVNIWAFSGC